MGSGNIGDFTEEIIFTMSFKNVRIKLRDKFYRINNSFINKL